MEVGAVIRAANYAAVKHRRQRRKDSHETPYVNHPIGVANILVEEAGINDSVILQSALLHDTVEDTDATLEEIEDYFGPKVRNIVAELTDDKSLPFNKRKDLEIANTARCCYEAKMVKLADKLHNLRDLQRNAPRGWDRDRVQSYFEWASQVIRELKGTNQILEDKLRAIFVSRDIVLDY